MANLSYPGWPIRDKLASNFRFALLHKQRIVPWMHQATIFAYLDGKEIFQVPTCDVDDIPQRSDTPYLRTIIEQQEHWLIGVPRCEKITLIRAGASREELVPQFDRAGLPLIDYQYFAVGVADRLRPQVVSISGSFKNGKSVVGGNVPASFAQCPGLRWDIWGMEYDICEPEFEYIVDALLGEKGMALPKVKNMTGNDPLGWIKCTNDPKQARMHLHLSNNVQYVCRSFRKTMEMHSDPLKGKERDGFSIAEMYQFPNIDALLEYRQNLAKRKGYFVMPSTPDRPIMDVVNSRCDPRNDDFPRWLGVKEVHRRENPHAFDIHDFIEDCRTKTDEYLMVYWEGKTGRWINAVYPPVRYFNTVTHPELWKDPEGDAVIENFLPPAWMDRRAGVDTGTNWGCVSALRDDAGNVFFIGQHSNYDYRDGSLNCDIDESIADHCEQVRTYHRALGGRWRYYADWNSQWKDEYRRHGLVLRKGTKNPERRCVVTAGLAQNGFVWFAPWLKGSTLVTEWEAAKRQPKGSQKGGRVDGDDHLLDCAEHVASVHDSATQKPPSEDVDPYSALIGSRSRKDSNTGDPMLGGG